MVLCVFEHSAEGFAQRRRRERQAWVPRNCRTLARGRKTTAAARHVSASEFVRTRRNGGARATSRNRRRRRNRV